MNTTKYVASRLGMVLLVGLLASCGESFRTDMRSSSPDGESVEYAIRGGEKAPKEYPEVVKVISEQRVFDQYKKRYVMVASKCTGTFLSSNVVLTAGHCVTKGFRNGKFTTYTRVRVKVGKKFRKVKQQFIHPLSRDAATGDVNAAYDLAVLVLGDGGPVPAGFTPQSLMSSSSLAPNSALTIVGFGLTDTKSKSVKRVGTVTGRKYNLSQHPGVGAFVNGDTVRNMNGPTGQNACGNDAGGPVYLVTGDARELIGVSSVAHSTSTNQLSPLKAVKLPTSCAQVDYSYSSFLGTESEARKWLDETLAIVAAP